MFQRFGYGNAHKLILGTYYPETTLIAASLEMDIIKYRDILKEFSHPNVVFINLNLLARLILDKEYENETTLQEELETVISHAINGQFLHEKIVIDGNESIRAHLACHPRMMRLPFTNSSPIPVLVEKDLSTVENYQVLIHENSRMISPLLRSLVNHITPPPILNELLMTNGKKPADLMITWNELPGLHHIWGIGCEWGFFPLTKNENKPDLSQSSSKNTRKSLHFRSLTLKWIKLWGGDVIIIIDDNHALTEFLSDLDFIHWFALEIKAHILEQHVKKDPTSYLLIPSTPYSWVLLNESMITNSLEMETFLRRINHLMIREHLISDVISLEHLNCLTFSLKKLKKSSDGNFKSEMSFPTITFERILLFLNNPSQTDGEDCEEQSTKSPIDYLERNALKYWKQPLPLINKHFLTNIPSSPLNDKMKKNMMRLSFPLTSLAGSITIIGDVLFQPFSKIPNAPNFLELMTSNVQIKVKTLLQLKIWINDLKKHLSESFSIDPESITFIIKDVIIEELTDATASLLPPEEQKAFRHLITDKKAALKMIQQLPVNLLNE